jgi:hypothetical protein
MTEFSKKFLERTIEVWQPYSPTPLTLEDAKEIAKNTCRLFKLLNQLDKKYNQDGKKI